MNDSLSDFSGLLERVAVEPGQLILLGDFNIHVDSPSDAQTKMFCDLLDSHNMRQHVSGPTHKSGHTLDLVLTKESCNILHTIRVADEGISDHSVINCVLDLSKPTPVRKVLSYRKTRNINIEAFSSDLAESDMFDLVFEAESLDEKVSALEGALESILATHAPKHTRSVVLRPNTGWYNDDIRQKKKNCAELLKRTGDGANWKYIGRSTKALGTM